MEETVNITISVHKDDVGAVYHQVGQLWKARKSPKNAANQERRRNKKTPAKTLKQAEAMLRGARLTANPNTRAAFVSKAEDLLTEASSSSSSEDDHSDAVDETLQAITASEEVKRAKNMLAILEVTEAGEAMAHGSKSCVVRPIIGDECVGGVKVSSRTLLKPLADTLKKNLKAKMMVYAPPGAGKTFCARELANARPELVIGDTDDNMEGEYDIVFTNLPTLIPEYPTLKFKYSRDEWDEKVRTKCPGWKPSWYDDHLAYEADYEIDMTGYVNTAVPLILDAYETLPWKVVTSKRWDRWDREEYHRKKIEKAPRRQRYDHYTGRYVRD